jgi:hypothetical protein
MLSTTSRLLAGIFLMIAVGCSNQVPGADAGSTDDQAPDAGAAPDAEPSSGPCDPLAQLGCGDGDKCTYVIDSTEPLAGHTGCVPAGAVAEGAACTSAVASGTGYDDCAAGLFCGNDGACTEICNAQTDGNCDGDETCVAMSGLFLDLSDAGLCQPACDPLASPTGCEPGAGCYLSISTGQTTCAATCPDNPVCDAGYSKPDNLDGDCAGAGWGTQDCYCECQDCCAPGYGCVLTTGSASVCAYLCDASASGGPDCSGSSVAGLSCEQISSYYEGIGQNVPPELGMCAP